MNRKAAVFAVIGALVILLAVGRWRQANPPVHPATHSDPAAGYSSPAASAETKTPRTETSPADAPSPRPVLTLAGPTQGQPLRTATQPAAAPTKGRVAPADLHSLAALTTLAAGDSIDLPLPDGTTRHGTVNLVRREENNWVRVGGSLDGGGGFSLGTNGKSAGGIIQFPESHLAYELRQERDGQLVLIERPLGELRCDTIPRPNYHPAAQAAPPEAEAVPPPTLNSRTNSSFVLYLDFDGETVTDPLWANGATIVAPAARLNNTQITEVFNRVKEDYWAFNINVTTELARYTTAPAGKRMRIVITQKDTAAPGAGGVAYISSFDQAGTNGFSNNIPAWCFIDDDPKPCADAISHELGHTMGLQHDGRTQPVEEYYAGQGSGATGWAPIMGVGYYQQLVQWSKGEYAKANRTNQDDIAIIANAANGFGFVTDEAGGTIASAAPLNAPGGTIDQPGVITQASDIDVFSFSTAGGSVTIHADPAAIDPNVDILLELLDSGGSVVATDNPVSALNANITKSLAAGTFYVRVRGTGKGDPLTTGYTSYGCIGTYNLTGTIAGMAAVPVVTSATSANGTINAPFSYQIVATNAPMTYSKTGTLPMGVTLNSGNGLISGTPTETGTFNITVSATNAQGTGSKDVQILIMPAMLTIADALEQTGRSFTLGGNANWFAQNVTTFDGVDAAQSGAIGDNQSTFFETTISGPATVSFRWAVSSEATYDFLRVAIDGTEQTAISGSVAFETKTFALPSGSHVMRWTYTKDETVGEGSDAGFVDALSITSLQKPAITSAANAAGTVGQAFSYQIAGTNSPTSYSVTGTLPGNVTVNTGTGLISGTPSGSGTFNVTIGATNSSGTGTAPLTINIASGGIALDAALDTPGRNFVTGGDLPWVGQNTVTFDGADAAKSGAIVASQESRFETTITGPVTVSFRWKVDSEEGYDYLRVFVDDFTLPVNGVGGAQLAQISGSVDWTLQSIPVGAGDHVVRWTYAKDATLSVGADAGWVDVLTISSATVPVVSSPSTVNGEVGVPFDYQVTASGSPTSFVFTGNLPPGLEFNTSSGIISGEPTNAGTFVFNVTATNSAGTSDPFQVTATVTASALTLTTALDAPGLVWTTAGDLPWVPETNVTHDGFDAAQVHGLTDGQQSSLSTTITGPAGVRFFWKVDSESGFDFLVFLVDGVERERISGSKDWSRRSLPLGAGAHTLTFRYQKDASVSEGQDRAWVDEVAVVPLDQASGSDDFADASPLDGTLVVTQGDNTGTTTEGGEPVHAGITNAHTLWWAWTAPKTGKVTISTAGSAIDTVLAVYTGDILGTLTPVVGNDDVGRSLQAAVKFFAVAGETYKIAVASDDVGAVKLLISYLGANVYTGLLRAPRPDAPAGIISFSLNERLSFTSSFTLGKQRVRFRSSLTSDPQSFHLVFVNGSGSFDTTVVTADSIGTDRIEGTLDFGGDTYPFTAVASLAAADLPLELPGSYTFLTSARAQGPTIPGGAGYGRISVSTKGKITATGVLGDGRKFSAAGPLTIDHSWTLFATDPDKGSVAGDIFFDAGGETLQGLVRWVKPANNSRYPAAFSLVSDLFGSAYIRPSAADPLFSYQQASVSFASDAGLDVPARKSLAISPTGKVSLTTAPGLSFSLSTKTGLFSGRTVEPVSGAKTPFGGAVLQIYDYGSGTVLLPDGTATVLLQQDTP